MSSEMAWRAASFTSAGAAKSGKPCERFTAPCFIASRVISRITDSVNCSALAEIMRREICAIFDSGLLIYLRLAGDSKLSNDSTSQGSPAGLSGLRRGSGRRRYSRNGIRSWSINHPVQRGVAQHDLHVVARFREWNGLDKFRNFFISPFGFPECDAVFARVVRGEGVFRRAGQINQALEIVSSEFNVVLGIE